MALHTRAGGTQPCPPRVHVNDFRGCMDVFEAGRHRMNHWELQTVLRTLGCDDATVEKVRDYADRVDVEGAGTITLPEFTSLVEYLADAPGWGCPDDELREAYRILDVDERGAVKAADILKLITQEYKLHHERDIESLMKEVGIKPSDDNVTFRDFVSIFMPPPQ